MKRKRGDLDDDEDEILEDLQPAADDSADAQLARALHEEHAVQQMLDGASASRRRTRARTEAPSVQASLDDDLSSDLSSIDETSNLSMSPPASHATPRRQMNRRTARDSAKKSIAATVDANVFLDDSEGSDFDLSMHDSDGSESVVSDNYNVVIPTPNTPAAPIVPAAAVVTQNVPSSRRRAGRRRTTRARRGRERFEDFSSIARGHKERVKLAKHHPEVETMWTDLEAEPVIHGVQGAQPATITRQLKSFQLEGLDWMKKQEKTKWKGGILGDEMGMGKTIQAVSLIMSDYPAKQPSLVVVPPVALMQWQNEIREYTHGKLKVFLFHGAKAKKMQLSELKKFDVIMTSYSTLEATHRKERKGWTRMDSDNEKVLIKEDSPLHTIRFHRVILDEAHSIKVGASAGHLGQTTN
jgi:DNA repair protein RAD16